MPDLILELFSEEIPARMQSAALAALTERVCAGLAAARLEHGAVRGYVTPRRLALHIPGLPARQPDLQEERKGPKVGAPDAAVQGFAQSCGVTLAELEQRPTDKGACYFAVLKREGTPTASALVPVLEEAIQTLPWPKSMRWGAHAARWVRPLCSILCLLDDAVVPVRFGHLQAGRTTRGHRFLAPDVITVPHAAQYIPLLEAARVVPDADARRAQIAAGITQAAAARGLTVRPDAALLDEVTGLVEWPVVLTGEFEPRYLDLPAEVLVSIMRGHQKYFTLLDAQGDVPGKVSNVFAFVANMETADQGAAIVAGNARVLRARLADGAFFRDLDRATPLPQYAERLGGVIFHAKLGTIADKVRRMEALIPPLAHATGAAPEQAVRAVRLCKADLTSGMVGEFAELQGLMGRYYALAQGEHPEVADAIRDHYAPQGPQDAIPAGNVARAVALADKLDTLAGMFTIGEKPTGSRDPFALRRAALGVIRIVLEGGLRLSLRAVLTQAVQAHAAAIAAANVPTTVAEVLEFLSERLKVLLREQGVRADVLEAVAHPADGAADPSDLTQLVARARAVQAFADTADGTNLLSAHRRSRNILLKTFNDHSDSATQPTPDASLCEPVERTLLQALSHAQQAMQPLLTAEDYTATMHQLAALRAPVDAFFDQVMVDAPDPAVRTNRQRILHRILATMHQVADFSGLQDAAAVEPTRKAA